MPDVLIRHCTLRIVRRGGWSWGPEPVELVRGVIGRIGELLERKLPGFWPDDEDFEIAAPVRIRIPVRLSELLSRSSDHLDNTGLSGSRLDERIERAIDAAFVPFAPSYSSSSESSDQEENPPRTHAAEQTRLDANQRTVSSLLRLLLHWNGRGILAACLADFSLQALEAWHHRLLETTGESPPGLESPSVEKLLEEVRAIAEESKGQVVAIRGEQRGQQFERATQLRLRLLVAVEATQHFKIEPRHPALRQALDRILPLSEPRVEERGATIGSPAPAKTLVSMPSCRPWQGEFSVSSALPFLLLGPLSRIGYLEALTATLEATGLPQAAPFFAQALAYKVLSPPGRGWRHRPADVTAATVFAGRADPIDASELADFARKISPYLSPLDTVLKESLIAGHSPNQPLLLHRLHSPDAGGLLLVDVEGIFPVAWADLDDLIPTLARFGATALLVPQASIEAAPLDRLDDEGFCFITDAPPTRNETWRALRQPPNLRFWTNDRTTPENRLITLASLLAGATEEAGVLWQALAVQRPCIPLASDQALDRSVILATAAALGTIAWVLWRKREPVAPYLALDRFYDLDARVTFGEDTVRVRLPMGRRHRDLYEHGFLQDAADVPWLDGRVLQFSGG